MDNWMVVFVGIIALCNLVTLAAVVILGLKIYGVLNTSVKPILSQVEATMREVKTLVSKVEDKAEQIMDVGENTARRVSGSVTATTDVVTHGVASPLMSIISTLTGISRAIETLRHGSARA